MEIRQRFNRRAFLGGAVAGAAGALLVACGAPATPTAAPAPKAAEPTKPAAAPTTAAAAAPTTAPAAAPTTAPAAPKPTEAPAAKPAAATGPAKLVFWKFGGATSEVPYVRKVTEDWGKANNVTIEYSDNEWSVKREKMIAAFQAKRIADVLAPDGQSIPDLATLGAITALDDLDKRMTDSWKPNYIPEIWNTTVYKGKFYAIAPYVDSGTFYTYNKEIFKASGVTKVPTNWDEVREAAKACTKGDIAGITISVATDTNDCNTFEGIAYANGGRWLDEAGKKVLIADQVWEDALTLYMNLVKDNSTPKGPTETNFAASGNLFLQSKVAVWVSLSYLGAFTQSQNKTDFPAGMVLFPKMTKPSGQYPPAAQIMTPTLAMMVTSQSQQKETAMKLIDFWMQPAQQKAWDGSVVLGRVPALKATWESDTFKKWYPDWAQMYKDGVMFKDAQPMPAFPGLAEAEKALSSAMQSAVLGKATPKDALAAAAKRAQTVVNEFQF